MTPHAANILRLRESGLSYREIGALLGISKARVGYILKKVRREQCNRPEVVAFRKAAQGANTLDVVAPIFTLVDALGFGVELAESITAHFSEKDRDSATLREVMDIFIPQGCVSWKALPIHFLNDIRESTYMAALEHLSRVDLGTAFEQEWKSRKVALMECEEVWRELVPYLPKARRLSALLADLETAS